MRSVGAKHTKPERFVRSTLWRLGYRFTLHDSFLPGRPDIVFSARRKAIFVNGCFWHGHSCKFGQLPKSNLDYWKPKLAANKARDRRALRGLAQQGWKTLVLWQCELGDESALRRQLRAFLGKARFTP